jgi:hypothetical protein
MGTFGVFDEWVIVGKKVEYIVQYSTLYLI